MSDAPITYAWDGEAMRPVGGFARKADEQFVIGERYRLEVIEERSAASHAHEFAWLREAWQSLPERLADQYPSAEHLRKRALIDAGYYHETVIDAGSNAAALRVATYARSKDEFALVFVRGVYVVERTAKSQSRRAMKPDEFQASKTAIMEVIADLLAVSPQSLSSTTQGAGAPKKRVGVVA